LRAGAAPPVDLFVAIQDVAARPHAFTVLRDARSAGFTAQMELAGRSLKRQLGHADRLGARYVAIVDGSETVLKDMQSGAQETIDRGAVVHAVLRGLREIG
jgi:histidyl-tRNA synthetase